MKDAKCLTCKRIGQYKNGHCFWCNRRIQFNSNIRLGYNAKEYTGQAHNQLKCKYPHCNNTYNRSSNTRYCIKHRVMINHANTRTN